MTNEEWNKVKEVWFHPYITIRLECDDYELSLQPYIDKGKIKRSVYVNGWMRGEWLNENCEEGRRFMRVEERFIWSAKDRKEALKHFGKKLYKQFNYDKKYKMVCHSWLSFSSFKRHIIANNKEIKYIA